jgi:4-alpha-glucanotransferase
MTPQQAIQFRETTVRTPRFRLNERAGGILLHPTSLPGPHGSGDLGPSAERFVDFLAAAGQRWWQMLPVGPPGPGNSPYSARSAFAGGPLLISLERLAEEGLLERGDLVATRALRSTCVAYPAVTQFRTTRLRRAYAAFLGRKRAHAAFEQFCHAEREWLADYALYAALRRAHGTREWLHWPRNLRLRQPAALRHARTELADEIKFEQFCQFQFHRQWQALRRYAHAHGVGLIGDVPIFVAHDSADVWAHRELFQLDADGRPKVVSGVPPDYFSRSGQLWGHPHYRWPRHRATGFAWWLARLRRTFTQFDAVRVDHFLGFHRVWAVSGRARTARHGRWMRTPGAELLATVRRKLGRVEIIAEDLGVVTPAATALRERYGFPGMRLLHFAFGNDAGDRYNQPHSYARECVVYPGTHDNDTTVAWFESLRADARRRRRSRELTPYERVLRYTGTSGREIHWDIIRLAYASVANTAIIPLQDILGLGRTARMNRPGTPTGNWEWRATPGCLTDQLACRLRDLAAAYDRSRR